ncbi:MAG: DegT/DnrJ/EryC1/StrS family aminotransferase [Planctomycetes bacterium]|nr:DegT/DnrJ/EryC1/StrS family aminotransferase [Planctomycetota bacterium]
MRTPILDLKTQLNGIRGQIDSAINEVLSSTSFIMGPSVEIFEKAMARYLGVKHAISCASGSDALLLCNMALKAGAGSEIITTPYTFFATAGSIARLGAVPVFVDIDMKTYNISVKELEAFLAKNVKRDRQKNVAVNKKTGRTIKAIQPVHLYGQASDMDAIMQLASDYDISVIEDAAQSIGSLYNGKYTGAMGLAGCFSFYPTKNLGAYGDGGAVATDNDDFAILIKTLRAHGGKTKYYHQLVGINSRLDSLQAAVLNVKLPRLDEWIQKRIAAADIYDELFKKLAIRKVTIPFRARNRNHTFHQYVIRTPKRNELREFLKQNEIGSEIYYPLCLHQQECFAYLGYKNGDFPNAEKAANETLALPIYPEIAPEQQEYIAGKIGEFFKE